MKFLAFAAKHLGRTWLRTGSTVVALALCVFLFCVLRSVLTQMDRLIEGCSPRRLLVQALTDRVLPLSYGERIRTVRGVQRTGPYFMFFGLLPTRRQTQGQAGRDWTNAFPNVAVDAESYFAMNPELLVPADQLRGFRGDLRGCVVGRRLAEKFGWRIGDRFHLESVFPGLRKKSGPFEFVVRGLMEADVARYPAAQDSLMVFHYRYLDEGLGGLGGTLWYQVEIDDPARATEVAGAIDALFENSSHQTSTVAEKALMSETLSLAGNLSGLLNAIAAAVCFTILLVTANTMSMAVRERRTEIAVLKTLGFRSTQVLGLIVAESLMLGAAGGALGVAAAQAALAAAGRAPTTLGLGLTGAQVTPMVALLAFAAALLIGLLAGIVPAWGAYRARVTEMLRTV